KKGAMDEDFTLEDGLEFVNLTEELGRSIPDFVETKLISNASIEAAQRRYTRDGRIIISIGITFGLLTIIKILSEFCIRYFIFLEQEEEEQSQETGDE
ncbi:hypothetical protein ACOME3_010820, partial [Neoechinorhynchus agilis]